MDASKREDTGRNETEQERLDRNLEQLLGELRVALPGVQVLFAFLLVVPFNHALLTLGSRLVGDDRQQPGPEWRALAEARQRGMRLHETS